MAEEIKHDIYNNTDSGTVQPAPKRTLLTVMLIIGSIILAGVLAIGIYSLAGVITEKAQLAAAFQERYDKALEREQLVSDPHFRDGVVINDIDLSGMSYEDGKAAVEAAITKKANNFKFNLMRNGEVVYTVDAENVGLESNINKIVFEAYSLARKGTLEEIQAELADIKKNGRTYTVSLFADDRKIQAIADELKPLVEVKCENASFTIDPTDYDNFFKFTREVYGSAINVEILGRFIDYKLRNDNYESLAVPVFSVVPDVTVASLSKILQLRATFSTSYAMSNGANRVFNIKKASGLVNGTIVQPGEVFSINECLGNRTLEAGWKEATAIIMGGAGTEDQPGGGVCQVSTTLYNAVVMSDLEVVDRRGHTRKSAYADGGRDATIDSGRIDFKFRNNTDNPIYIFCWVDARKQRNWVSIYGEAFPATFDYIDFESKLVETKEPTAPEYIVDNTLATGYWKLRNAARVGYVYDTYKVYYLDGKVVKREYVDQTEYRMHPTRYYVWPGYVPGMYLDPLLEIVDEP